MQAGAVWERVLAFSSCKIPLPKQYRFFFFCHQFSVERGEDRIYRLRVPLGGFHVSRGLTACPFAAPPLPSITAASRSASPWQCRVILQNGSKKKKGYLVWICLAKCRTVFPSPSFSLRRPPILPPCYHECDICHFDCKFPSLFFNLSSSFLLLFFLVPLAIWPPFPRSSGPFQFFIQLKDPRFKNSS